MNTLIHEEQYRGLALIKKMKDQTFTICGAGAIGSNLVENMARQGFKIFTVIDMDRVDDHNRHTQAYGRRDIGQLKVNALKSKIFDLMNVNLETISRKLESSTVKKDIKKDSIVIDGFDNSESRKIVTEHCQKNGIVCLHVGLYKDYAEIHWNEGYRVPEPVTGLDVCEYPLARNIILMAVSVATEVLIRYLDKKEQKNYSITLGDMHVEQM
ncbi:MAG: ThiF family adenylyltransferase [Deltaproteobacteria bacterium]|nr:MAG: ThiF family adenylyltransferase [Deltaproteobacteria bacterium]